MLDPKSSEALTELPSRIHEFLEAGGQDALGNCAFIDENGNRWSYAELIEARNQAAKRLKELNVQAGDRIMLVCENSIAAIVTIFAASSLDAIVAIINARQTAREIDGIRDDCEPRRVIYTDTSLEACEHAGRDETVDVNFGAIGDLKVSLPHDVYEPQRVYEDAAKQAAVILYTTGTTGRPKGVMLSHKNLAFVGVRNKRVGILGPKDTGLCLMPIAHSFGFAQMISAIYAGTKLIVMRRFDLEAVLNLIDSGELTAFGAVPALYSKMIDHCKKTGRRLKPNALRFLLVGTSPLDLTLRRAIEKLLGVTVSNGYGLTETSPTISRSEYKVGSDEVHLGKPIEGVEVKIVDDAGNSLPAGEAGELCVRGPNVMLGYYNNSQATDEIIDSDGFLHTGDVVRLREDGILEMEGRAKELIIRSGFNVYPVEVEAQLNAHPAVLNSAVVGCDEGDTETVFAFLERVPKREIDIDEVRCFLRDKIAGYKVPSYFVVLDALPYSPNAKILKKQLKDRAQKMIEDETIS